MKSYLRNAVVEALAAGDDLAAGQLMDLVLDRQPSPEPAHIKLISGAQPLALPTSPPDGFKSQWDWAGIIEEQFVPTVETSFTTSELHSWITRNNLLSGEEQAQERATFKTPKWKSNVGNALGKMKDKRLIRNSGFGIKTYFVTPAPAELLSPAF